MPQISVPVAILLKTITPEIYTKKGVVYGTPWDAPDQHTCCHFAQNNHSQNLHKKGVVYGTPWDAPDQRTCCNFAQNMYKSEGI
jgi:hypothetical protein